MSTDNQGAREFLLKNGLQSHHHSPHSISGMPTEDLLTVYAAPLREKIAEMMEAPMRFIVTGCPVVMATDFDALKQRADLAESRVADLEGKLAAMEAHDGE